MVQAGHMPPPDPDGPGTFSMASETRTRELLEGAGCADVRMEQVPALFAAGDGYELPGVSVRAAAESPGV